jgi:hypothetical protein
MCPEIPVSARYAANLKAHSLQAFAVFRLFSGSRREDEANNPQTKLWRFVYRELDRSEAANRVIEKRFHLLG